MLTIWAAELLTGAHVGQDGMTAFRRLRGRPWESRLAEFAEQVMSGRPRALLQGDAEPWCDQVTYLGSRWGPVEHWVADERHCSKARRAPQANARAVELRRGRGDHGTPDEPVGAQGERPKRRGRVSPSLPRTADEPSDPDTARNDVVVQGQSWRSF